MTGNVLLRLATVAFRRDLLSNDDEHNHEYFETVTRAALVVGRALCDDLSSSGEDPTTYHHYIYFSYQAEMLEFSMSAVSIYYILFKL